MGGTGSNGEQPMGQGNEPKAPGGTGSKGDQPQAGAGNNDPKNPNGGMSGPGRRKPTLPLDDPFTKQVWGHLPEKLRQQAMQSYKEQFMPRYNELLKQYYSNIAERDQTQPKK